MKTEARDIAMDAALAGKDFEGVVEELRIKGSSGVLTHQEIERILYEAATARSMKSSGGLGRTLPRIIGIIACAAGVFGIWAGWNETSLPSRGNPLGVGVLALVFGMILVWKPSLGFSELSHRKNWWHH